MTVYFCIFMQQSFDEIFLFSYIYTYIYTLLHIQQVTSLLLVKCSLCFARESASTLASLPYKSKLRVIVSYLARDTKVRDSLFLGA